MVKFSFDILRLRDFRFLLLTRMLNIMALQIQAVIVGWQIYSLTHDTFLVHFTEGEIALRISPSIPRDFPNQVAACLTQWTGRNWKVFLSDQPASPSLHEQAQARKEKEMQYAAQHPLVGSVLDQFPGATLVSVS